MLSREDAIAFGNRVIDLGFHDETQAFCEMAIKALEQEPCEDAVNRAEVKNKAIRLWNGGGDEDYKFSTLIDYITELPPVTPTRKKGKWLKSNIGGAKVCSICQTHMGLSNFKFCPNCGAEMESE